MVKLNKKSIIKLSIMILVFAVAIYFMYAYGWIDLFTDLQRLIQFTKEHRTYAVCVFIGLQVLQVVFAPIPGEVTGFAGGVIFGAFWGIVYSTIGLTLGSWIAFALAKAVGRPLVESIVSAETTQKYDYVMKHKGIFLALLLFIIPGFPKDYLCYLLGLGSMGHGAFLLVVIPGRLLGTALLTLGGTFFRDERYVALFTLLGISLAIVILSMVYGETMSRWFRRIPAAQLIKHRVDRAGTKKKNKMLVEPNSAT
jgi:uncharacterized membrane protein YdjX (TVP38/TMEM64 family)